MKSSLVRLKIGSRALYNDQVVIIRDFVLTPNGLNNPELVCIVYGQKTNGNIVSATSNNFKVIDDEEYEEFYPTPHSFHLDELNNRNLIAEFIGEAVIYIPEHIRKQKNFNWNDKGIEYGFISRATPEKIFVKYIQNGIPQNTAKSTNPEDLIFLDGRPLVNVIEVYKSLNP